ncbi:MAG: MltA domain-containing protein [Magnetococcales bacterium]|nr:MltA domain-containing protein [Magnetococcales bacterium]
MRFVLLFPLLLVFFLTACQPTPAPPTPEPPKTTEEVEPAAIDPTPTNSVREVPWSDVPPELFQDGQIQAWADALMNSATYYRRVPAETPFTFGATQVTAAQMHQATRELAELARLNDPAKLQQTLQKRFRLFRSIGGNSKGNVLVTGYYEPLLHGSLTRSKRYFYPIYRLPPEGKKGKAPRYASREQIDAPFFAPPAPEPSKSSPPQKSGKGAKKSKKAKAPKKVESALANQGLELVWVDNVIDAFFLHIQGSGRVQLDNGQMMRIGYHGTNGKPYQAIGRILIDEGKIPHQEMTMPRLRQWLMDNPKEVKRIFFANPSYVYFRVQSEDAVGNINVPLTKERSIATDHRLFPKGAPGVLMTTLPEFAADGKTVAKWNPDVRFIVNQDTGGAIRGAGRVDMFFGFGPGVENRAGVMKQNGSRLYFIAPRTDLR